MKKPLALILPLVVVVAAFAAGCGSSSDSSGDALSKSDYISQANAICKKGTDELNKEVTATFGTKAPSKAEIVSFTNDKILPNLEQQLSDLQALNAPSGDEATTKAITDALSSSLDALKSNPTASTNAATFAKANKLASDYGLTACGQG